MPGGYLFYEQIAHELEPAVATCQTTATDTWGRMIVVRWGDGGRIHDAFPFDNPEETR